VRAVLKAAGARGDGGDADSFDDDVSSAPEAEDWPAD
jgi:hypothetical protein